MVLDKRLQLAHELGVASGVEVVLDPPLEASETQLLEAGDLALREALVRELGERRPAPEQQRLLRAFPSSTRRWKRTRSSSSSSTRTR